MIIKFLEISLIFCIGFVVGAWWCANAEGDDQIDLQNRNLKKIAEKYPTLTILEFIETYKGVIK